MQDRMKPYSILVMPLVSAICGLLFCIWNVWHPESTSCISSGCAVFLQFAVAGVSLWWIGIAGFALLAVLALVGRPGAGKFLAACGLWIDCGLLIIMIVTAPCLYCLVTALLLALTYLLFPRVEPVHLLVHPARKHWSIIGILWTCLFLANLGTLANDSLNPWPISRPASGGEPYIRIYVSPSCPACRKLVENVSPSQLEKIAWYPVAEDPQDMSIILAMQAFLEEGQTFPKAFALAMGKKDDGRIVLPTLDDLFLQIRLWRNQAHVTGNGGILPLVEFQGVPSTLLGHLPARPASTPRLAAPLQPAPVAVPDSPSIFSSGADLPPELANEGFCDHGTSRGDADSGMCVE